MFLRFWKDYPQTAEQLLPLFPHYGYWKDLLRLIELTGTGPPSKTGADAVERVEEKNTSPSSTTAEDKMAESAHSQAIQKACMELMKDQLWKDISKLEEYKKKLQEPKTMEMDSATNSSPELLRISLLAKWLPRENSSSDKKSGGFVKKFAPLLWPHLVREQSSDSWESILLAKYRKTITELTSYLALPEVLLATHREDEIQFERLASKATFQLRQVFLNQNKRGSVRSRDPKRIRLAERFRTHVLHKGLKGGQLMPHEIVSTIFKNRHLSEGEAAVLDAQWKDLWQNVVKQIQDTQPGTQGSLFNPTCMVPMADVSGSMSGTPMEVSIALSIGLSEITHDAFKHMILTFSEEPTWHLLNPTDTIVQKVRSLQRAGWGMSTDFKKAYDLILDVAEKAQLSRENMPTLIVFSDMQFDEASGKTDTDTMHDVISQTFSQMAHRMGWEDADPIPIVYWNLRNTGGHPVNKDTPGAVLLAGFSPSLLKHVLQGDALAEESVEVVQADGTVVTEKIRVTPEEILHRMLDDKIYDPVRAILATSTEGRLCNYESMLPREDAVDNTEDDFVVVS